MARNPDLETLIDRARNLPPPTALERLKQLRVGIKAEFSAAHPELSPAEVDAVLDRTLGSLA